MNSLFVDEAFEGLISTNGRTLITSCKVIEGVDESFYERTEIKDGSIYVTLTPEGVEGVLKQRGMTTKLSEIVLDYVNAREASQLNALLSYLKLEKELGGKVVSIMLRDANVSTDSKMFKTTYNLPLKTFFRALADNNYSVTNLDTMETVDVVEEADYYKFLFANKQYNKLLSVFIDITGGAKESD